MAHMLCDLSLWEWHLTSHFAGGAKGQYVLNVRP